MTAPKWIQRIQENRYLSNRRKFWEGIIPASKLVFVENETGSLGLSIETFQLEEGNSFENVRSCINKIREALRVDDAAVCPVGMVTDYGEENIGTISREGFRVVWSAEKNLPSIFDPSLTQRERDYIARVTLVNEMASLQEIGYCPLLHARLLTDVDADTQVVAFNVISRANVSISSFEAIGPYLRETFKSSQVEFSNDGVFDSSMMVSIIIKAPNSSEITEDTPFITTGTIPVARAVESAKRKLVSKGVRADAR